MNEGVACGENAEGDNPSFVLGQGEGVEKALFSHHVVPRQGKGSSCEIKFR